MAETVAGDIISHCDLNCGHQIVYLETFWKWFV